MDLGNNIYTTLAITPQTLTSTTAVEATGVDRLGYEGAVINCFIGTTYGAPTGVTVTFQLQESSDNSIFTDVTSATAVVTTTSTSKEINQDLIALKRYIRMKATPDFVGGTAPYVIAGACLVLGGARVVPV